MLKDEKYILTCINFFPGLRAKPCVQESLAAITQDMIEFSNKPHRTCQMRITYTGVLHPTNFLSELP